MSEATFTVRHHTGETESFTIKLHPEWAPKGVERFLELAKVKFWQDSCFHRVVPNFMAQFGLPANPSLYKEWGSKEIPDDPVKQSNKRGMVTFANRGPNSRTVQMFINYGDNDNLDSQNFAPFGEIVGDGMKVIDKVYGEYGDSKPKGNGPDPTLLKEQGKAYSDQFDKLTVITKVEIK